MRGPHVDCLWGDETLGLTRFSALRVLTQREIPSLCPQWLSRLPLSLRSLTVDLKSSYRCGIVQDSHVRIACRRQ